MEDALCDIKIVKENDVFVAFFQDDYGGTRECCRSENLEEVVSQLSEEILEQYEYA